MQQVRPLADHVRQLAQEFMDAGKRELASIGGNGRSDPAKALAKENESLKIVVGELTSVNAELEKSWELRRG